jgi:hypothetical protein
MSTYDMEKIVVGREAEVQRFRDIMMELLRTPTSEERALVMLLWGLGGIGKTTLTRIFHDTAQMESPFDRAFHVELLDWEVERSQNHRLQVGRDALDPEDVLDAMVYFFDPDQQRAQFRRYRSAKEERREAERKIQEVVGTHADSRFAWLSGLTTKVLAALLRWGTLQPLC